MLHDFRNRHLGVPPLTASAPDFFGFNAQDELQYRGRLDASRMQPVANTRRDLFEAIKQIADTGHGPEAQTPSMGLFDQVEGLKVLSPCTGLALMRAEERSI